MWISMRNCIVYTIKNKYICSMYKYSWLGVWRRWWILEFVFCSALFKSQNIRSNCMQINNKMSIINAQWIPSYVNIPEDTRRRFDLSYNSFVVNTRQENEWPNIHPLHKESYNLFWVVVVYIFSIKTRPNAFDLHSLVIAREPAETGFKVVI